MSLDTLAIIFGAVLGATLVRGEAKAYRRRRATARVTIIDAEIRDPVSELAFPAERKRLSAQNPDSSV